MELVEALLPQSLPHCCCYASLLLLLLLLLL
jgi:hypothetical protein